MSSEAVRDALLWCTVMNVGLLAVWSILCLLPHEWIYRLTSKCFRITEEQFDAINFGGIVFYKVSIFLFNLVPYVALRIVL